MGSLSILGTVGQNGMVDMVDCHTCTIARLLYIHMYMGFQGQS